MSSHRGPKKKPPPPVPAHFRLHAPLAPPPAPKASVEAAFQPPRPGGKGDTSNDQREKPTAGAKAAPVAGDKSKDKTNAADPKPDAVPSAPAAVAASAAAKPSGPRKTVDLSFLDDSDDEEDSANSAPKAPIMWAPRNSATAEAYTKRMKELEEAKESGSDLGSKSGARRSGGKVGGNAGEKEGETPQSSRGAAPKGKRAKAHVKDTSPEAHAKVKHTPKVAKDAPPQKAGLKSPPEELAVASPKQRRGKRDKRASSDNKPVPIETEVAAKQSKRVKNHVPTEEEVEAQPCPDLGPGWTKKVVPRKGSNTKDSYYYSPGGERFRSKAQAAKFLAGEPGTDSLAKKMGAHSPAKKAAKAPAKEPEEEVVEEEEAEPEPEPCPEIGAGWTRKMVPRKGGRGKAATVETYYHSPEGKAFRTMAQVMKFLEKSQKKPAAKEATPAAAEGEKRRSKRKRDLETEAPEEDDGGARRSKRDRKLSLQAEEVRSNEALATAMTAPKLAAKKPAAKKTSSKFAVVQQPAASSVARGRKPQPFQAGDRVEAKYRGRGKRYYPGTIVAVVPPGNRFDIDYDDGDKDSGLSAAYIRRLEGAYELMEVEVSDGGEELEEEEDEDEYDEEEEEEESDDEEKKPKARAKGGKKKKAKRVRDYSYLEEKKTKTWVERIAMLKAYKKKYGTCNVTERKKEIDPKLLSWVLESRKQYKRYARGKQSSLSAGKIEELEALGFDFTPRASGQAQSNRDKMFRKMWDEMYEKMEAYKAEHGDCLVSCVKREDTPEAHITLANWTRGQRKHFNKVGREGFDPYRLAKLEEIGFDFDPMESQSYKVKKRALMSARIQANWQKHFQNLVQFKEENGNLIVGPKNKDWPGLYNWIHCQRKAYKKWEAGDEKALMFPEWIEKMNEIGFDWAPMRGEGYSQMLSERKSPGFESRWNAQYQELVEYKEKYGTCVVPGRSGKKKKGDHTSLAGWIHVQRKHKRNHDLGKRTPLTAKRIQLLDELGLDWAPKNTGGLQKIIDDRWDKEWDANFEKLCAFKEKAGHANPKKKEPGIGPWASRMRQMYQKNLEGEATTLTDVKIAKLQSVGFDFVSEKMKGVKTMAV